MRFGSSGTIDGRCFLRQCAPPPGALHGSGAGRAGEPVHAILQKLRRPQRACTVNCQGSVKRDPVISWRVRPLNKDDSDEIYRIAYIQASCFQTSRHVPLVGPLLYCNFAAEVLSEMRKKARTPPDYPFASLVLEERRSREVVGVVEVSRARLQELQRSKDRAFFQAYISSMAVEDAWRRRGGATALLEAAEGVAREWGQAEAALHVYADNGAGIALYTARGYARAAADATWLAAVGVRPRVLLTKRLE
uniref:N-acetyltransferase domain-containing protein n=1 Tax=Auxenochlorella protothecoides TaxID=3075 RepID=A0A1D2A258_AUXPR